VSVSKDRLSSLDRTRLNWGITMGGIVKGIWLQSKNAAIFAEAIGFLSPLGAHISFENISKWMKPNDFTQYV
jgi:hypothetical protein